MSRGEAEVINGRARKAGAAFPARASVAAPLPQRKPAAASQGCTPPERGTPLTQGLPTSHLFYLGIQLPRAVGPTYPHLATL